MFVLVLLTFATVVALAFAVVKYMRQQANLYNQEMQIMRKRIQALEKENEIRSCMYQRIQALDNRTENMSTVSERVDALEDHDDILSSIAERVEALEEYQRARPCAEYAESLSSLSRRIKALEESAGAETQSSVRIRKRIEDLELQANTPLTMRLKLEACEKRQKLIVSIHERPDLEFIPQRVRYRLENLERKAQILRLEAMEHRAKMPMQIPKHTSDWLNMLEQDDQVPVYTFNYLKAMSLQKVLPRYAQELLEESEQQQIPVSMLHRLDKLDDNQKFLLHFVKLRSSIQNY